MQQSLQKIKQAASIDRGLKCMGTKCKVLYALTNWENTKKNKITLKSFAIFVRY